MKTAAVLTMMLVLTFAAVGCSGQDADTTTDTEPELVGTTWLWQEFVDMADEGSYTVPNPENYTLTLQEDGTANLQADCNQVTWTYTMDGGLTFDTVGVSTLAFCGEDSLDQQYLERLGQTATYVFDDGGLLHLNLAMDSGNMVFAAAE